MVAGRILLALVFVISGYGKLVNFDGTASHIRGQMTQFLKNLCIMGGMLYLLAFGVGR